MDLIPCETCGGTDFTKQSGFYICNICDTQSQNIQEQSHELETCGVYAAAEDKEEVVVPQKSVKERTLTSWECYNILLRELVEELIVLGASPKLKVIAFQLWASYLKRASIAFTSKTEEKLPYLSLGFKNKDAKALYGVSNLRDRLFNDILPQKKKSAVKRKKKSRASSDVSTESGYAIKSLRRQQKRMSMNLTDNDAQNESCASLNDTMISIERERRRKTMKRKQIPFKPAARKALTEALKIAKNTRRKSVDDVKSKRAINLIRKKMYDAKTRFHKDGRNVPTNTFTLISILRIALLLIGDDIQLGDILRWICEGRLSVNQPEKFVPKFYFYVKKNDLQCSNRNGFQIDIKNVTLFLNLSAVPTPNLYKLAERYCTDLCLPDEFIEIVLKIMALSKPKMDYSLYKFRIFPDYECRVMAFILYAFKLLFSLDDYTEFCQSKFAEAVNERREQENAQEISKLFVWTNWMKYVECRKAVLSEYDVSVNQLSYDGQINNEKVFLNYWNKLKPIYETNHRVLNAAFVSSLQSNVRNLIQESRKNDEYLDLNFPASDTPFQTSINYINNNHPHLLSSQTREVLSEKFKCCSVKFIWDETWCNQLAEHFKLNSDISFDTDDGGIDPYVPPKENVPVLSKTTIPPADTPTLVTIEEDSEMTDENQTWQRCTEQEPRITIYNNETNLIADVEKSIDDTFKIYNPSRRFWVFHEFHRRISIEQFNSLITENLSKSFIWLLKECAAMLRVDLKELYLELIQVETVLCCDFYNQKYAQTIPLKLFKNEW